MTIRGYERVLYLSVNDVGTAFANQSKLYVETTSLILASHGAGTRTLPRAYSTNGSGKGNVSNGVLGQGILVDQPRTARK